MNIKILREKAIKRYINGESPKEIYQSLGKGKTWFFKWLKRYYLEEKDWSKDHSRKPHLSPKRINKAMEQLIVKTRKQLVKQKYAQVGAANITWHLQQAGMISPSMATINRVIKRYHLIQKRPRYSPKGTNYPCLTIIRSNELHQIDMIGPRYLKGDGKFYAVNILDAFDRRGSIHLKRRQNRVAMTESLVSSWKSLGIPRYLQMDNVLSVRGSNQFPHAFGQVIRLCLYLRIQPVFIPIREPWRNGIIEHFQNTFDKMFFRAQHFENFDDLCQKAKEFEYFHNHNHHYSTLGGRTPHQKTAGKLTYLPANFPLPDELVIHPGHIHLIRFIRSDHLLDIFGEKYAMPSELEYEYIWATIDTERERLKIHHDQKLIREYPYPLPKNSILLSKDDS